MTSASIIDKEDVANLVDKWSELAVDAEEATLRSPIAVILGESVDIAALFDANWNPSPGRRGVTRPGFVGIARKDDIYEELGAEIRELQIATAFIQSRYLRLVDSPSRAPLDQADHIVSEIRGALAFLFDDGKHDESDAKLERVESAFADSASQDTMALALEAYADLAEEYRTDLEQLEGFDLSLLDEARPLAAALRDHSAEQLTRISGNEQREVISLRNRLLTLLLDRVDTIRRAARYLYRNQPSEARKFMSAYDRDRRRARRRAQKQAAATTEAAE